MFLDLRDRCFFRFFFGIDGGVGFSVLPTLLSLVITVEKLELVSSVPIFDSAKIIVPSASVSSLIVLLLLWIRDSSSKNSSMSKSNSSSSLSPSLLSDLILIVPSRLLSCWCGRILLLGVTKAVEWDNRAVCCGICNCRDVRCGLACCCDLSCEVKLSMVVVLYRTNNTLSMCIMCCFRF